ncbi:4Fe-4S binding protein [Dysgonomonas sp. ZJ709]|uniref:4Fe-4S binding protein n=1 Tax=Dysgonomonas sp. ZJ709 TaxID=2709797 RepID=UPI0013EBD5C4|nr:4Fe-4S binding protein [Dysgonomonas sp. ZJ709]
MLRKIRVILASFFFILITVLFLDFTGTVHTWFGWMANIQFVPALLALNVGVVAILILLTLLFGRIYCSVICPLGIFQDAISWIASKRKKNRFSYSPALSWLRYGILILFAITLILGISSVFTILEPYSAYGRIASNLFAPIYQWGNNLLAYLAERADSYTFYSIDVWMRSVLTLTISIATFIILAILAWRNGRTYCNTICPVGTVLGFISRFSFFRPAFIEYKCNGCGLCARNCKAACIDSKEHTIDYSRCVTCMNCIEKCKSGAIVYAPRKRRSKKEDTTQIAEGNDSSRRNFLSVTTLVALTSALKVQEKAVDGGLAVIEDKKIPKRATPIVPPGSESSRNMERHCTACGLCVSVCPNHILRPSSKLATFMQPEMSFEHGYCRPECTKCSEVCPTAAIKPITTDEKSSIQIGHAVWIKKNCVVIRDKVRCTNCERHCPTGAIQLIPLSEDSESLIIPAIDTERCIGCGACESLCPARPFSAIYVEGHERHKMI